MPSPQAASTTWFVYFLRLAHVNDDNPILALYNETEREKKKYMVRGHSLHMLPLVAPLFYFVQYLKHQEKDQARARVCFSVSIVLQLCVSLTTCYCSLDLAADTDACSRSSARRTPRGRSTRCSARPFASSWSGTPSPGEDIEWRRLSHKGNLRSHAAN